MLVIQRVEFIYKLFIAVMLLNQFCILRKYPKKKKKKKNLNNG